MRVPFFTLRLGLLAALLAGAACSSSTGENADSVSGGATDPIVGGRPASDFPESAIIDILSAGGQTVGACSGAVVAPRVVLTAGHCVADVAQWRVRAPFAGNQTSLAKVGITDYVNTGGTVNPDTLDVAVIVLDQAIELDEYPALSSSAVPDGTQMRLLGRIREQGGQVTNTFFVTNTPVAVRDAAGSGFPLHYLTVERIQPGDSGGPNILESSLNGKHVIAGVNSGGGGGTAILARVERMFDEIQQIIAQNGGTGAPGDPGDPGDPGPSCQGLCGGQSPAGCFCDAACAQFGDCCPDKASVCQ
jgi:hypothetical protein